MALEDFLSTSHVFLKSPICLQRYITISPVLRPFRSYHGMQSLAFSTWRDTLVWNSSDPQLHQAEHGSSRLPGYCEVTENVDSGEELSFPHDIHIKVILETEDRHTNH